MNKRIATCLALSFTACIDTDADFGPDAEILDVDTTEQSLGSCTYTMLGAAITKQIVSVDDNDATQLLIELTTVTNKPYRMWAGGLSMPPGFQFLSLSSSCTDQTSSWKCRHAAQLQATTATSGTGAYTMYVQPLPDAGSGCAKLLAQKINFSLTTETFQSAQIDADGDPVILYGAADYAGTAIGFEEGYWAFTGARAHLNDIFSSAKVAPGYAVTLFENLDFTGNTVTFTADTNWVGSSYNDMASAVWVRRL